MIIELTLQEIEMQEEKNDIHQYNWYCDEIHLKKNNHCGFNI